VDPAALLRQRRVGLQVSTAPHHRVHARRQRGPDVSPEFSLASVGSLKWHVATCRASREILSDWAQLTAFLKQHLDSVTLDQRDAAAIANALAFAADAGSAHTSVRAAAVAALARALPTGTCHQRLHHPATTSASSAPTPLLPPR